MPQADILQSKDPLHVLQLGQSLVLFDELLDDRVAVIDVILDVLWQVASCLLIKGLLV